MKPPIFKQTLVPNEKATIVSNSILPHMHSCRDVDRITQIFLVILDTRIRTIAAYVTFELNAIGLHRW